MLQLLTAPGADGEPVAIPATTTLPDLKVAIVHDWCPDFRGGERVLARFCRLFPRAEVFTLFDFLDPEIKARHFPGTVFHTSPMNRWPGVRRYYRSLFPLCPMFVEQFDVTGFDLVLSSSAAFARGVLTRPDQPHLCYVHSPPRYAWDEQFTYMDQAGLGFGPKGLLFRHMLHRLRIWDARTAHGPDLMVANSEFVRARIRHIYGRDASVIHPPVEIEEMPFTPKKSDYYVAASFLAPYKRTDLVLRAFREMPERKLLVVGGGQQSEALRALAAPNIRFTGYLERSDYIDTLRNAKAMIFAGCEDFGIALAEAQACGTPVIALGRGGVRDIVRPLGAARPTGVLFSEQSVASVQAAVEAFEQSGDAIDPAACRANAQRFSAERFDSEILAAISRAITACDAPDFVH